ncbi:MAG: YdcF family protein [Symploca sp. SIO1B1]|nr:YdcF family protein [Symploca sp. SIO1C2]NER45347.1 YdcF family protein [Symploca sp. SIO1A3]NER93016.1 YdcF family protein [Symploca sp. SIO1B1]
MFLLLTQILLWGLITYILYRLLTEVIPKQYFTLLGALFLFGIIALAFFFPNDQLVSAAWKVISFPLKPLGAAIVLLIIALRQGLAKSQNLVVTAMVVLLISSMPFFANLLAQRSETVAQTDPTAPAQTTGAIVLLGRGSALSLGQTQLNNTGDLVFYTSQLYQASGNQPLVIVSPGRSFSPQGNQDQTVVEANDIATLLTQVGVPRSRIVTESSGLDLRGRAREIRRVLQEQGLEGTSVTVVSPGFGSRIAGQAFSDAGINVIAQPAGFFGSRPVAAINRLPSPLSFVPSEEALTLTTRVVEEFLTSIYYALRGSLSVNPGNLG